MRELAADAPADSPHRDALTLPFDQRQKSRLRARLDSGEEVAVVMPRGRVLRGGDLLRASDGAVVLIKAAPELVSTVRASDPTKLARAAYHLGNRHIPVQIGLGWLRYQQDHVLDDMLHALGLAVRGDLVPFEPEAGAYGHGHAGEHGHEAAHEPEHEHEHGHDHGQGHEHDHGQDQDRDHGRKR